MSKRWEDMATDEKLDWLRHEDQSTRQWINTVIGEINNALYKLSRRIDDLEAGKSK